MLKKLELKTLSVDQLQRGKFQPRQDFEPKALEELALSLKSVGLLQPIVVRKVGQDRYEIIAGERRWRAAQMAGIFEVPCLINQIADDQAAEAAAVENVIRVDLNPIEEAKAYQRLIDDFHYTHQDIALAIGKNRSSITNALRLLTLAPVVQTMLIEATLSEGHGKVLAGLNTEAQVQIATLAAEKAWSVRKTESVVKNYQKEGALPNLRQPHDPNIQQLEKHLSDHMGCSVNLSYDDRGAGRLAIDFHNLEVLAGIFKRLNFEAEN